jgi:hypothetical protein
MGAPGLAFETWETRAMSLVIDFAKILGIPASQFCSSELGLLSDVHLYILIPYDRAPPKFECLL